MFVDHVALEIPASYIDGAANWYEDRLGLTRIENPIEPPHTGHDAVHYAEGIHLVPNHGMWHGNTQPLAHFCLQLDSSVMFVALKGITRNERQEGVTDSRFFITDPWNNKIEVRAPHESSPDTRDRQSVHTTRRNGG